MKKLALLSVALLSLSVGACAKDYCEAAVDCACQKDSNCDRDGLKKVCNEAAEQYEKIGSKCSAAYDKMTTQLADDGVCQDGALVVTSLSGALEAVSNAAEFATACMQGIAE